MRLLGVSNVKLVLCIDIPQMLGDQIGDRLLVCVARVLHTPHGLRLSLALARHPLAIGGLVLPLKGALSRDLFVVASDLSRRRLGARDILAGRHPRLTLRLRSAQLGQRLVRLSGCPLGL